MAYLASNPNNKVSQFQLLWLGLLVGPAIWAIYFFIGYGVIEAVCHSQVGSLYLVNSNGLPFFILIWTLTALWIALYANYFTYQNWRRLTSFTARQQGWSAQHQTVALAGLFLSALFTFIILTLGLLPVFLLRPCF